MAREARQKMKNKTFSQGLCTSLLAMIFIHLGCQTTPEPGKSIQEMGKERRIRMQSPVMKREESLGVLFNNLDRYARDWRSAHEAMDFEVRNNLEKFLRDYVKTNYDMVEEGLRSEEPRWREIAAGTIGFSERRDAVYTLVPLLADSNPCVRSNALLSLWKVGDKSTPLKPILERLQDEDGVVQQGAALALTTVLARGRGEEESLLPLIQALRSENPYVRSHAARALGVLGNPGAMSALIKALDDEVPLVRIRAALALGSIGDAEAVKSLAQHLSDSNPNVQAACFKALTAITGRNLGLEQMGWIQWYEERSSEKGLESEKKE